MTLFYSLFTFGCQMNHSDSTRVESVLRQYGLKETSDPQGADLIILNSCSVRQQAEDRVIGKIRECKKQNVKCKIGITGCLVRKSGLNPNKYNQQISADKLFKKSPEIDFVFKIQDLSNLPQYLTGIFQSTAKSKEQVAKDTAQIPSASTTSYQLQATSFPPSAFVPITTGCNNFCTYCVVPYARGSEIGRQEEEILCEIKNLVERGCKEITLLGQNVNSYMRINADQDADKRRINQIPLYPPLSRGVRGVSDFVSLLEKINRISGLERIRYTSPHPKDMGDDLIQAHVKLEKMCNHIHLPVQSGDNNVLKRMNRNYTREHYLELIEKIKKTIPRVAISTDIIVGFPGETEKEFQNTYDLFKTVEFDMAYLAQYSPRPETYAAKNFKDDVPAQVKKARWEKLNALLKKTSAQKCQEYIGRKEEVLIEKIAKNQLYGRTKSFKEVKLTTGNSQLTTGQIVKCKIVNSTTWALEGRLE